MEDDSEVNALVERFDHLLESEAKDAVTGELNDFDQNSPPKTRFGGRPAPVKKRVCA